MDNEVNIALLIHWRVFIRYDKLTANERTSRIVDYQLLSQNGIGSNTNAF